MAVTFESKLLKKDILDRVNGYTNVVHRVKWQLIASFNDRTATSEFTYSIPFDQTKSFIPFEQLADEQIMTWVFEQIHPSDLHAMRLGLAAKVQSIK